MNAYDVYGNSTVFEVDDLVDNYDEAVLKDLEEIRDSMDNEGEFKASFFDLEKDVSDFQDDTEKRNKYSHEFDEDYLDDITSARGLDISVDEAMMLHESRGPYSANFSTSSCLYVLIIIPSR